MKIWGKSVTMPAEPPIQVLKCLQRMALKYMYYACSIGWHFNLS